MRPLPTAVLLAAACPTGVGALAQPAITATGNVQVDQVQVGGSLSIPLDAESVAIGEAGFGGGGVSSGSLVVERGAAARVGQTLLADGSDARTGVLAINGFGTSWTGSDLSAGGADGRGVLRVSDGGLLELGGTLDLGGFEGGSGTLEIDGFAEVEAGSADFLRGRGEVRGGGRLDLGFGGLILGNGGSFDLSLSGGGELRAGRTTVGSSNGGVGSTLRLGEDALATLGSGRVNAGSRVELAGGTIRTDFFELGGGAVEGSGRIEGELRIVDGAGSRGRVTVSEGQQLIVRRGGQGVNAVDNGGLVENSGTLDLGGSSFFNNADGLYLGRGGIFRGAEFRNEGPNAAVDLLSGANGFDARFESGPDARVTVTGEATVVFQRDFFNEGALRIDGGSRATFAGDFVGNLASGSGESIVLGNLRFSVRQPAAASFSLASAQLAISAGTRDPQPIGGTLDLRGGSLTLGFNADGSFDAFNFTSATAVLLVDETPLDFNLASGFNPEAGDRFEIFRFFEDGETQIDGSFAIGPEDLILGGGLSFDASELVTTGFLTVVPEPASAALLLAGTGVLLRRRRA